MVSKFIIVPLVEIEIHNILVWASKDSVFFIQICDISYNILRYMRKKIIPLII